jgi:hypothetical protein
MRADRAATEAVRAEEDRRVGQPRAAPLTREDRLQLVSRAIEALDVELEAPLSGGIDERDRITVARQNAAALQALMPALALANEPE